MMKPTGLITAKGPDDGMLSEKIQRPFYILDQQRCQIPAYAMAHENTLNGQILTIGWQ